MDGGVYPPFPPFPRTQDFNGNRIIIDCTENPKVAEYYQRWLTLGAHVVSCNKHATAGSMAAYRANKMARREANTQWLYECSGPGSGLPVLSTLQDMQQTGDRIHRIEGVFSGTINYVLGATHKGVPFSEVHAGTPVTHPVGLWQLRRRMTTPPPWTPRFLLDHPPCAN